MKCTSRIQLFSVFITIAIFYYSFAIFSSEENILSEEKCDIKDDLKSRKDRIDKYCDIYSNPFRGESSQIFAKGLAEVNSFQYFSFKNSYTMICSIQKAGSNSMHNFLRKVLQAYINEPFYNSSSGNYDANGIMIYA